MRWDLDGVDAGVGAVCWADAVAAGGGRGLDILTLFFPPFLSFFWFFGLD